MSAPWVSPITLELSPADEARLGAQPGVVRLTQLSPNHAPALWESIGAEAGAAETLKYHPGPPPRSLDDMRALVQARLDMQANGLLGAPFIAFVILHRREPAVPGLETTDGLPIGITTYLDIQPHNRALEIGFTWVAPRFQRSRVNTECKYLLLRHAFETLGPSPTATPVNGHPPLWSGGALRVQLKGDHRNQRSLNAVKRIGATHEGTLRHVRILHDGHLRDTWYASILREEWETRVKGRIEALLRER